MRTVRLSPSLGNTASETVSDAGDEIKVTSTNEIDILSNVTDLGQGGEALTDNTGAADSYYVYVTDGATPAKHYAMSALSQYGTLMPVRVFLNGSELAPATTKQADNKQVNNGILRVQAGSQMKDVEITGYAGSVGSALSLQATFSTKTPTVSMTNLVAGTIYVVPSANKNASRSVVEASAITKLTVAAGDNPSGAATTAIDGKKFTGDAAYTPVFVPTDANYDNLVGSDQNAASAVPATITLTTAGEGAGYVTLNSATAAAAFTVVDQFGNDGCAITADTTAGHFTYTDASAGGDTLSSVSFAVAADGKATINFTTSGTIAVGDTLTFNKASSGLNKDVVLTMTDATHGTLTLV